MTEPFHKGERAVQLQTGEREHAAMNGKLIADRIPASATLFIAQQYFCILGWASPKGDIWASMLAGWQGFATADGDGVMLRLRLTNENGVLKKTPPFCGLQHGDQLGGLFIELATRRRLRVNGRVEALLDGELHLAVAEAYPNCPKFIQRREVVKKSVTTKQADVQGGNALNQDLEAWIAGADTFFVASAHPDGRTDASHRGGKPGFIRIQGGVLRIPDYPGNSMFGTLGNFALNPRAGLSFIDFERNRQLLMTGEVRLDLEVGDVEGETGGTGRWWEFHPRKWIIAPLNRAFDWGFIDASPLNP
ncbi:probable iron-sulfur binding protein YPO1417 [hydrothermal vent metagenome]|uniref:Probable iron-sulfur binding protein YPO1417 n=1 Tax=hydrothermal vent metagenome TaxID=652676 RepID=A0A3B0Z4X9_9ZZZZ